MTTIEASIYCNLTQRAPTPYHIYLINLTVIVQLQTAPLSLEIVKEAPVGHIWHHYGNAGASIETHPNQGHDMRMVEVLHLVHLTHHALNIRH